MQQNRFRFALLAVLAVPLRQAAAQLNDTCRPGSASNEAHTMASFDVPLAFSAVAAPARPAAGRVQLGLEFSYLPKVDPARATPTICRPDKQGPENTDLLFAAPRPRVRLALPAGFALEASWIPPVRMSQVRANVVGIALSHTTAFKQGRALLELRAHGSVGVVEAPITCDDAALQDASSPCYQGTRSNDAFRPNVFGLNAALGWTLGRVLRPYLGAGYAHLAPRFRVNFTNQFQVVDRRRVVVDLDRGILFAGVSWLPNRRLELSSELYSAPVDAVTLRVMGRVTLR
jgi:diadenosine tetraphosphatase ApaH/serine/threonine PP2A family protein phosphatase